ncbi:MAG: hypothetical protein ACTHKX_07435 [Pseudolysinimonas sp.]
MSTPDSVHAPVLLPVAPRLTVVPRPVSSWDRARQVLAQLPPAVVAATGLMAIQTVAFFAGRLLAVSLTYDFFVDSTGTARVLGAVSFLSIVVIASAIALGHRGMRVIPESQRITRHVTAIVLGVSYLHLILWVTRVVAASIASAEAQSAALLMPNIFWWG